MVTGFYGTVTETAVKQWQKEHGITQTGGIGPRTAAAMKFCTNITAPPPTTSTKEQLVQALLAQVRILQDKIAAILAASTIKSVATTTSITTCTPFSPQTQTLSCPAGQTGSVTQTKVSSCPGPMWSNWTTISNTCVAQQLHYDYGYPLKVGTPLVKDVLDGTAHFQSAQDSQVVLVSFADSTYAAWDMKMSILKDPQSGIYFTYVRKDSTQGKGDFNIYLMRSDDQGRSFREVGPIFAPQGQVTFYEPHIAIDDSQYPTRYIMTLECAFVAGTEGTASCISVSTDPFNRFSWSVPKPIVSGCDTNSATGCTSTEYESGATPVTLVDGVNKYIAWASVEFPGWPIGGSGFERVFSAARTLGSLDTLAGYANEGMVVLDAEKNTNCTSGWDCNNANVQDWKKEGWLYYIVYNGSNYFSCPLLAGRTGTNIWGISLASAFSPLGPYTRVGSALIRAERTDDCGVQYGVINNIEGELYMYYTFHPVTGGTQTRRSKIVWNSVATAQPRGWLENVADCSKIVGWAQDMDVPSQSITTRLYFDGPAGTPGLTPVIVQAGDYRADLCTPLGSCSHAFSVDIPAQYKNGVAHTVFAYGMNSGLGNDTLLEGSPRTFQCQ